MPESMRFTPMTQRFAEPARVGPVCADPAGSRTELGAIMVAFPPPGHRPRPWPRQPRPVANPVARPRSRPDPTRCGTIPARTEVRQRSPPPPRRTSSDGRRQVMPPITANPRSVTTVDGDCRDPDPGGTTSQARPRVSWRNAHGGSILPARGHGRASYGIRSTAEKQQSGRNSDRHHRLLPERSGPHRGRAGGPRHRKGRWP
jgi:hypothetical protein